MSFESANNYAQYCQYLELKHNWQVCYKGINLVEACAIDLIDAIVTVHEANYYHIACALFQRVRTRPIYEAFKQNINVFTFAFPERKDHLALSNTFVETVENSGQVILEYFYTPYKSATRMICYWRRVRNLPLSFKNRLYIAARMAGYSCVVDDLEKQFSEIDLKGKRLIPFCAAVYHEALLTLFFKKKGVTTFYTFHGVFGRYKQYIANDVVNGENIISDYVLTYGESQRKDLIRDFGVPMDKIIVAGNPKYPYHPIQIKNTFQSCLILGGIGIYDDALGQLLLEADKVSEMLGIKMALKPHPLSKIYHNPILKQIKNITLIDKSETLSSLFKTGKYDFAITHNTSSYYECMMSGLKPFRWGNDENVNFEGLDDRFYSAIELERLIKGAKMAENTALSKEAEALLADVVGFGINKYNEIINKK